MAVTMLPLKTILKGYHTDKNGRKIPLAMDHLDKPLRCEGKNTYAKLPQWKKDDMEDLQSSLPK